MQGSTHWLNKVNIGFVVLFWLVNLGSYQFMPPELPYRFNFEGMIELTGPKGVILILLPILASAIVLGTKSLVAKSPKGYRSKTNETAVNWVLLATLLLLAGVDYAILYSGLSHSNAAICFIGNISLGLFCLVAGKHLPHLPPNFFIGIRTPWSLLSIDNWKRVHRLAGRLLFASGVVMIALAFPVKSVLPSLVLLVSALMISILYSYIDYRHLTADT